MQMLQKAEPSSRCGIIASLKGCPISGLESMLHAAKPSGNFSHNNIPTQVAKRLALHKIS